LWLTFADERPVDAQWLSTRERAAVERLLAEEQREIDPVSGYRAAFFDTRVVRLAAMFACFCSASYGLVMWLPGIVAEGAMQRPALTGFLTSLPYVVAIFSMLAVAWASDRTLKRKPFVVASMALGCAAFCVSIVAGRGHFAIAFLGLVVVGSCNYMPTAPLWAWIAEILPQNVVGESMALVNTFGALGGFIGTLSVGLLKDRFHSNTAAFIFQAACFAAAGILAAACPAASSRRSLAHNRVPNSG
jgi:sugar phosphate permease